MTRISLLEPDQLPPAMKKAYEDAHAGGGDKAWIGENYSRIFGHHPELTTSYAAWYGPWATSTAPGSVVPQRIKELVRLRIATLNGCVLCKAVRMAPQVVEEMEAAEGVDHLHDENQENGQAKPKFTEAEIASIVFAEKMALDHHNITDEDVQGMLKHFDEKQFLELSMQIGQFIGFGRVLAMLQLENSSCPMPTKKRST